jgi:hypothetical protein|tara:strand:+ start:348 stop:650 length:303 start_codon:yes stop_codon:yes gene_type:complete
MLFGGNDSKKDTGAPKKSGNADDLMDLLGAGKDEAIESQDDAIIVEDDAIVVEDDAIVIDEEVKVSEKPKKAASKKSKAQAVDPKLKNLTEEEVAILHAA